jgi:hypothetical protein
MPIAPMATGHEMAPVKIIRSFERDTWYKSPWAKFITEITYDPFDTNAGGSNPPIDPKGQPILHYRDFSGNDHINIPFWQRLYGTGILGDLDLEGNEESMAVYRRFVALNALAHSVNVKDGPMSNLRLESMTADLMTQAQPALTRWFSDKLTEYITKAFYYGLSPNLTAAAVDGGLAETVRLHPNIYIADQGWMDWSATAATYQTTINAGLDTLDAAATAARKISAELLETVRNNLIKKRIAPAWSEDFGEFWYMYVHPDVFKQAWRDEDIRAANDSAFRGAMKGHPLLNTKGVLYYNDFIIVENMMAGVEVHPDGTNDEVIFGPANSAQNAELNWLNNYESTDAADRNLKANLIVGEGAMSIGQAGSMDIQVKQGAMKDYNRKSSVGATLVMGAVRNDNYDNIGTPTAVQNYTSAVLMTNSAE